MSKDNIYCDECGRTITDNEECFVDDNYFVLCENCYNDEFDKEGFNLFWGG